jgi:hypothetical protein
VFKASSARVRIATRKKKQSALRSMWPPNPILIALALLIATAAAAGEFKRYPQPNGRPDHILVSGGIRTNDEQKFVELTADLKNATIILDSPGGNIWPSMRIGTIIRESGWETNAGFGCTSACAFIWLAGSFRTLGRLAWLGFHSTTEKQGSNERSEQGNQAIAAYLKSLEVPQAVIELATQADPRDMKFISYEEAKVLGLIRPRPAF